MTLFLVGYSLIVFVLAFVLFVILVNKNVIFKTNIKIKRFFAHPLLIYSLKRVGSALVSILLAITVTFILLRTQDKLALCKQAIGGSWDKLPQFIKDYRCGVIYGELGLNNSLFVQLLTYYYKILPFPKTLCNSNLVITMDSLGNTTYITNITNCRTFIMDLGKIFFMKIPLAGQYVIDVIFKQKMMHSFRIGLLAVIIQLMLGYPFGILMAKYKDGIFDKIGRGYIIIIDAVPGLALYYVFFAIWWGLGLSLKYNANNPLTWLAPSLTMGILGMAGTGLWVRRFMIDEFNSDYVKFARAKGLTETRIMFTHVIRNAIVPLIRSIPAAVLGSLLGAFYIEKMYNVSGLGDFMIAANAVNDYFAIQGIVVVSAFISILSYLAGDLVTAIADPRISLAAD